MCSGLAFQHHLAEINEAGHSASADRSSVDNSLIPDAKKKHFAALSPPGACKTLLPSFPTAGRRRAGFDFIEEGRKDSTELNLKTAPERKTHKIKLQILLPTITEDSPRSIYFYIITNNR